MTLLHLRDICDIQLGYQHRERVADVQHGSHRLIQGKDVVRAELLPDWETQPAGWRIATDSLDRVTPKGDVARYQLQPGDVLFVSRGTTNIAIPLNEDSLQPYPEDWDDLIAAYTFFVLRPDRSRVLPEYLAWFINQPPAQAFLLRQSRGSLVKLLPKGVFEELEIPVPSLTLQQKVVELEHLRAREESLLRRLIAARRQVTQHVSLNAVENHTHPHST